MNRKGEIKWSESSDEHRLYAIDSENNRSIDYIIVKNPDILIHLEGEGIQYYTSAGDIDDFFKVFLFVAFNSDEEWALHRGKDNSYTIGTLHEESIVGNWENFGIGKPISSVHSHPGITNNLNEERYSMSIDWKNVKEDISIPTRMNYVYFPNSKRLYFVEPIGVRYINSINKDYKRFYFGTLNHK